MIRCKLILLLSFFTIQLFSQQRQLSISRIDMMPNSPLPLHIVDWKAITREYDNLIFDLSKRGPYLPLLRMGTQGQFNYPGNTPFYLDSYVGANDHLNQAEAINIIPAIVGASLAGIDKSNQNGTNWVAATKDFFNLKNRQNVYLNNYSTTSGSDWWYDIMPNVYFYQLRSLYRGAVPEFESQFTAVADSWLNCVNQLGGGTIPWKLPNMNFRAFNLITGSPLASGVQEPESAGSIAWLLYNAWLETGKRKYFLGAQMAMEFLTSLKTNPSYELQLSYGTLTAARMNAVEGTDYPLQKLVDWCFSRGDLRGWGSIVGKWGDYDVSGLIGEANDGGNDYAFVMNGFQQAAALAPLPKYDKRYAGAIAKWLLNITNASRLFYSNNLPETLQDSWDWASANDPSACIPYESMREKWQGKTPFATGDAMSGGWASTNLSLYSGSSVGYLAAVSSTTNIPEILQIDLNKTDFYGDNSLVSYLYFNPTSVSQEVNIKLPPGIFGVYEAITETFLYSSVSDTIHLTMPAGEVRLIRLYPSGLVPQERNGRLFAGDAVLDYHYRYNYSVTLCIKALSVDHNPVAINSVYTAFCEPGNIGPADPLVIEWFLDDSLIIGQNQKQIQLTAPGTRSEAVLKCRMSNNGQIAEDTLHIQVVDHIPAAPVVTGIRSASKYTVSGGQNIFTALIEPVKGDTLQYSWSASGGALSFTRQNPATWQAPVTKGVETITVKVTNQDNLSTTASSEALVKDTSLPFRTPLIWYPFDTDDRNAVANRFHATATGVTKTDDARGLPSLALRFTSEQDLVYTDNNTDLNFTDAVSLSCWVKCEQLGSERFILSHGSWQQRYKLSITPEGLLRWTVKTNTGIADLDGSAPIELNRYYHITALYTGYSMELYIDGILDAFKAFSGSILPSTKPFTIGRMDNIETLYSLRGSVDEVKLWDGEIPVKQVEQLKNEWALTAVDTLDELKANIWPNPTAGLINIDFSYPVDIEKITLFTSQGKVLSEYSLHLKDSAIMIKPPQAYFGLYIIRIILMDGRVINSKIIIRQK